MQVSFNYDKGTLYGFQFTFSTKRQWVLYYRKGNPLEFIKGIMETDCCIQSRIDIIDHFLRGDDEMMSKFAHELLFDKTTEKFWKSIMHVEREELESFFSGDVIDAIKKCARGYDAPANLFVKFIGDEHIDGLVKNHFYLMREKGDRYSKIMVGDNTVSVLNDVLKFA